MHQRQTKSLLKAWDDMERLAVLARYSILDTAPEPEFDEIVLLATQICQTPMSVISLVEDSRQWFKAKVGVEIQETPINQSICAHGILETGAFIIEDTTKDHRFRDNPLVTGSAKLRFYAGVPITTEEGLPLGMMCVMDHEPRILLDNQIEALKILARQVMRFLDLRHSYQIHSKIIEYLRATDERLQSALNACGIGVWDLDLVEDRLYADAVTAKLLNLSEEQAGAGFAASSFLDVIHPDDHLPLKEAAQRTFEFHEPYAVEYRVVNEDGSLSWLHSRGACHYSGDNTPYRLIGCTYEIADKISASRSSGVIVRNTTFVA